MGWMVGLLTASVGVLPARGTVDTSLLQDVQVYFIAQLSRYTQVEHVDPADAPGEPHRSCTTDTCLQKLRERGGWDLLMDLWVHRMGVHYVITLRVVGSGVVKVFRCTHPDTETLPLLLSQMARAALRRETETRACALGVTEDLGPRVSVGIRYAALRYDPLSEPFGIVYPTVWPQIHLAYVHETLFADLTVEVEWLSGGRSFSLLVHRFLSLEPATFYLGVGTGLLIARRWIDPNNIIAPVVIPGRTRSLVHLSGGLALFRPAQAHMYVEGRISVVEPESSFRQVVVALGTRFLFAL